MTKPDLQGAVLGVDLGTSGVKVVALGTQGQTLAEATRSYPLLTPQPGWAEQDAHAWKEAALSALSEVASQLSAQQIMPLALGLSGQMHGFVPLDEKGEPIRPALLWNDARTGEQVREIERQVPRAELIGRTGNRAVAGFQLPKILWLRKHEPAHFARLRLALLPKDYLGFLLTGRVGTEPSDASGVGLLNLKTLDWDADLLQAFELPRSLFPEVFPSHEVIGTLLPEIAAQTGLPADLPVVAGGGDNAAAGIALGLSHHQPEWGSLSLGTSGVIFATLSQPTPDPEGRIHLFAHADGGFHLLGVTLAAGGALQWFKDQLAPERSVPELMQEAAAVPAGADGLSFLPYLAGERSPFMNTDLRGSWTGLSLAHKRGHLVRALLEGVALSLGDVAEVMRPLTGINKLLATGGGANSELWLGLCAAATGYPVYTSPHAPGAAHGAAILATLAAGWTGSVSGAMARFAPSRQPLDTPQELGTARKQFQAAQTALLPQGE